MPLMNLSPLINSDLQGAEQALAFAEMHPDLHSKAAFLERAQLRLQAAEKESLRLGLIEFQPRIAELKARLKVSRHLPRAG
ncbi:hypothetical protein [Deinococcus cellulosilyticus]|uniref:Uncharacterized protein n=1 Tax=Deinococcus cellulosilyticus (strain DSM 18568 / NBRC 106333 / KACC 11606 / 5516J-15) TaxID=1223518 RepID=A0A511MZ82_DEIC1|nr:hypothetical protein [Deinococcus cellulosilyticus]GEM45457.1 hypothetical protein DC3_10920 [Deinococcus cellulosilyticus NBRC 106333 = KACC 11606]